MLSKLTYPGLANLQQIVTFYNLHIKNNIYSEKFKLIRAIVSEFHSLSKNLGLGSGTNFTNWINFFEFLKCNLIPNKKQRLECACCLLQLRVALKTEKYQNIFNQVTLSTKDCYILLSFDDWFEINTGIKLKKKKNNNKLWFLNEYYKQAVMKEVFLSRVAILLYEFHYTFTSTCKFYDIWHHFVQKLGFHLYFRYINVYIFIP